MDKIKVIILDFDGVIVESVGIKDQAFRELYQGFPEYIDEIMAYHLAHNATIRFKKFRYISERILQHPYSSEDERELSKRFSGLVFQKIVVSSFVPGALEFLEHYYGKLPLYLVSMSPEDELLRILRKRELLDFFNRVYASNWRKVEAINGILHVEGLRPDQAMFIGDSYEDYQAAEKTGVNFIGRNSGKSFRDAEIMVKNDLAEIEKKICNSLCERQD